MCGEHGTCVHERFEHLGSSPHVRGARFILRLPADCLGIIPACAGSTLPDASGMTGRGDHPRMCGEHPMQELVNERAPGSSPHVRGAPCGSDSCHPQAGIIPACAGSTATVDKTVTGTGDHPRMCGEHGDCRYSVHGRTGSSPHVRGAHVRENIPMVCFGIIPACAGSTRSPSAE